MAKYVSLILSLPTSNPTERMRIWRSLKTSGAAVLRDGVYLLPNEECHKQTFDHVAAQISTAEGTAHVLVIEEPASTCFKHLFDRSEDYATLIESSNQLAKNLKPKLVQSQLKEVRKLRKQFEALAAIDFFPGEPRNQSSRALERLESAIAVMLSPDEPQTIKRTIRQLRIADYQGKQWATRSGLWIDRLASAWLIRKHIDSNASFKWLKSPKECPKSALGFDFDGASFTHTDGFVTFEVIAQSFGLVDKAITRLGTLIHALDVGGIQPPEAQGVEAIIHGLKAASQTDDELLEKASGVFDALIDAFKKEDTK